MEYEIAVDNECEKEVKICVPKDELNLFLEQETDNLCKKVVLKGFRKGRVPRNLVRARHQDTIKANAMNGLVTKSYQTILSEKNWQPVSPVQLVDIEEGETIKFRLRFEIIPDFTVNNYLAIELFKEKPREVEYLLEARLQELREKNAAVKETTNPAVVDNLVTLDMEIIDANEIKSKEQGITVKIGDRNLPDEINRALVSVKKGQKKEIKVGNSSYRLTINKVEEKILPELNDELAQQLNFKSFEELKKSLAADLEKKEAQRIEEELKESLAEILLERIRFSVPKSLVNEEYQKLLKDKQLVDTEANRERFWNIAEKRVRFNLIIDKIARKEGIQINDEELEIFLKNAGVKLDIKNRDEVIEYGRSLMIHNKTIDFLLKNAEITEKSRIVSPKEAMDAYRAVRY